MPDTLPLIDPTSAAAPADVAIAQSPEAPEQPAGDTRPALDVAAVDAPVHEEGELAGTADHADAAAGDPSPDHSDGDTPGPAAAAVAAPAIAALSPAACAAKLAELFPAVFTPGAPKPLKLRIQADIQERVPATFTRKVLSLFLQRHTTGTAYLRALTQLPDRVDLDGQPAGTVTDEHGEAASAELTRRRTLHDERRAAERQAQRQAQDEARRQHQHEDQARRDRAALLRAFDTSTLTRANFCALKGVPEGTLDSVLAQARLEKEQFPPAVRPERPEARPERAPGRPDQRPSGRADAPGGRGGPRHADRPPGDRERRPGPRGPQRRSPAPPKSDS